MKTTCFAQDETGCSILKRTEPGCGTTKCPFYKPEGCRNCIRTERDGKVIFRKDERVYEGEYE